MNLFAIADMALRRLQKTSVLTVCRIIGLVIAVALVIAVPRYSRAVSFRVFLEHLREQSGGTRPPFSLLFMRASSWSKPADWDEYRPVDSYLSGKIASGVGLPLVNAVRFVQTDPLEIFPGSSSMYPGSGSSLGYGALGFMSGLEEHIRLTEGSFPGGGSSGADSIDVLIGQRRAEEMGLQVGERYLFFLQEAGRAKVEIPLRIAGIWIPSSEEDPYWFYSPSQFEAMFLSSEEAFAGRVVPRLKNAVGTAVWYFVLDGSRLTPDGVLALENGLGVVERKASSLLQGVRLTESPRKSIEEFHESLVLLTIQLLVFSIPILALTLFFINMISGLVVENQANETAILASRGSSRSHVFSLSIAEGLLVSLVAFPLGVALGVLLAQFISSSHSFMAFVKGRAVSTPLGGFDLLVGLLALAISLATSLLPVLKSSGGTIISYKQEKSRSYTRPFWQRFYIDFFLMIPAVYGYYVLRQRGTISLFGRQAVVGDPFQNPLLFLVPTLFIVSVSLLSIRFFPLMMEALARLAARIQGPVAVFAFRQLARSPGFTLGPLFLLILTLSLAAFSASMARTLDDHLRDQAYYRIGADMQLTERAEWIQGTQTGTASEAVGEEGTWEFLPITDHFLVSGVTGAARAARYPVEASWGGKKAKGFFLGIDPHEFPAVAYFRRDFAPKALSTLMSSLSMNSAGVLASRQFLSENHLAPGDRIDCATTVLNQTKSIPFTIVDAVDFFPMLFPEEGVFFIGTLEYLFMSMGKPVPYEVLLSTDGIANPWKIAEDVSWMGAIVLSYSDARTTIWEEKLRPARQGVFGILSAGFLTASFLTVIGFMLFSFFSFQRRYVELGTLRAMGLSARNIGLALAVEYITLVLAGIAAGTLIGVLASRIFIPFLQVGISQYEYALTPPFFVRIAWTNILWVYIIFGSALLVAVLMTLALILRKRIMYAVKLGETI